MNIKSFVLWCVLIVGGGVFLRVVNLDSLPVFADEAIYVRWSQVMRAVPTLRFLPLSDGKQPLFMWLTIPFLKVISDPLVAARVFSALTGVVNAVVVGSVGYFLLGKSPKTAAVAGLVYAVLPYSVFFSRLALADSLLAMFLSLTFLFSWLSCQKDRLDLAMLAGFSLGFAWLTKSPAAFGFLLLPLGLLVAKHKLKAIGYLLITFVIALGMYNILRLGPEFHMIALRNQDYVLPLAEIVRHPLDPLVPHLKDSLNFYFYFLTPVGVLFLVLGLAAPYPWRQKIVLFAWTFIPIVVQSAVARGFTARYLLFTSPFAALLVVRGLHWMGKTRVRLAAIVLVVATFLFVDYQLIVNPALAGLPQIERSGYLEEWTAGFGIKEIAVYLKARPADTRIVLGAEGYFGTPFDGLKIYLDKNSNIRVIGTGIAELEVPRDLTNALLDNEVYWAVNSDRFQGTWDTPGLKLIASYPKSPRSSGSRQYLYFFQVVPK